MLKATTTIINKAGLHARAAAKLVELTGTLKSAIQIGHEKMVDGKSILSLMMLAAVQGSELSIEVDGPDEEQAMSAILALIQNRFDEPE
jgi:phosphocarrier protein